MCRSERDQQNGSARRGFGRRAFLCALLVPGTVLILCAFLLAGCRKKPEEERNSLVITAAETMGTVTITAGAENSGPRVDTVNGFSFVECDEMVYCTGDGVKLRKKPGLDGEGVGALDRGAYVHRVGKNLKWSRIQRDAKLVYISADYLAADPPETAAPEEEEDPEADPEGEAAEADEAEESGEAAETE